MKKLLKKLKDTFWGTEKVRGGSAVFVFMSTLSAVALITSNILAGKSFSLFNWEVQGAQIVISGGILIFPVTYILSDLFSEVYGYSASRRVTWLGFLMNVILLLFICAGILIPGANYYYENIVSDGLVAGMGLDFLKGGSNLGTLGILIASLLAFTVGSWVDDIVFEKIKKHTTKNGDNTGKFILRAVGSSFFGEIVDTLIFVPLLYLFTNQYGSTIVSFGQMLIIILVPTIAKTLYELLISPLTALLAKKLKKYEREHKYDL